MVNLANKLTIDDLIVTYLCEKTKQGYIPEVTEDEFMDFIEYYTAKKQVDDILFDYDKLINRFLERKNKHDWFDEPHMELTSKGILKPTNQLSSYDESIINIYFMNRQEQKEINLIIVEYLKKFQKRSLDLSSYKNTPILEECKLASAIVMEILWKFHIEKEINSNRWPKQCQDIIKYLLKNDLASQIELKSIKNELIKFYKDFALMNSILLSSDANLCISSYTNCFLAHSNYQLLVENENNKLLKQFCKSYGNAINIDYPKSLISVETLSEDFTYYGEDDDYLIKKINLKQNEQSKKLVKVIEKSI